MKYYYSCHDSESRRAGTNILCLRAVFTWLYYTEKISLCSQKTHLCNQKALNITGKSCYWHTITGSIKDNGNYPWQYLWPALLQAGAEISSQDNSRPGEWEILLNHRVSMAMEYYKGEPNQDLYPGVKILLRQVPWRFMYIISCISLIIELS